MAIRFIEIQKKEMSVEKWDKSLADMMEKGKIIQWKKFLLFPQYFSEEIAILQEIGILQ